MKSRLFIVVMFIFMIATISKVNAVDYEYIDGGGTYEFNSSNPIADSLRIDYDYSGPPTTVNYVDGAWTRRHFCAHGSSMVNIYGGAIGMGLNAYENSVINIYGGILVNTVAANDNSQVTISGGTIEYRLATAGSSKVFISGGHLERWGLESGNDSMVTISGGRVRRMLIRNNSQVTITGGVFDDVFGIYDNGTLIIEGKDFTIDGMPAAYGDYNFGYKKWRHITGTLSNDGVLNNDFYPWALTATIRLVPEPAMPINLDIKPQSCPNPLNVNSKGVLPVAILGTEEFDVSTIVPTSVRLAGVEPIRDSLEDVAAPLVDPNECECSTNGPDGFTDLTLKFETQAVLEALGEVNTGDIVTLRLTGVLNDETSIEGADCVVIVGRFKPINKADINKDGLVNIFDIAIVTENWLNSSIVEE